MNGNWAYGYSLNHEGAGVGTIYYASEYFDREGIVNPESAEAYTTDEINAIKANAETGEGYILDIPGNVLLGMGVLGSDKIFWYDDDNASRILKSAAPLILNGETGEMKTVEGEVVASPAE